MRALLASTGMDLPEDKAKDVLGEVYEYFLGQFAAEGKKGGQFYTPASVVRLLVAILAPHKGRIYDPCRGSGGMFVQSEKFVESHGGRTDDVAIYGQESNPTTWRLVAMNLAIRGIGFNLGKEPGFTNVNSHVIVAEVWTVVSDTRLNRVGAWWFLCLTASGLHEPPKVAFHQGRFQTQTFLLVGDCQENRRYIRPYRSLS